MKNLKQFYKYLLTFYHFFHYKIFLSTFLYFIVALGEGISLLLIIPMLYLIGISNETNSNVFVQFLKKLLESLGLPLNLESILISYLFIILVHSMVVRWQSILNTKMLQIYIQQLAQKLYNAVTYCDWLFISKKKRADLTYSLTTAIDMIRSGTQQMLQLINLIFFSIIHIIIAYCISPALTGLVLGLLVIIVFSLRKYDNQANKLGKSYISFLKQMQTSVMHLLNSLKLTVTFGTEDRSCQEFREINHEANQKLTDFSILRANNMFFYKIIAALLICIFFYIAFKILNIPKNYLFLLVYIFARLLPRCSKIHLMYQQVIHMLPCYNDFVQLQKSLEQNQRKINLMKKDKLFEGNITLKNVYFKYDAGHPWVLNNINIEILSNNTIAIAGPSGTGKSTLVDLLLGLIKPDRGQILFGEKVLKAEDFLLLRKNIGYVPQEPFLFHDSIRNNFKWVVSDIQEKEIWKVIEMVDATSLVKNLPKSLDTVVGDRGTQLSGGERQRLCLARALLVKPKILILDEATNSLDAKSESLIQQLLKDLHGKMTIITISHAFHTIRDADTIFFMQNGQIIEQGTFTELINIKEGLFKEMHGKVSQA